MARTRMIRNSGEPQDKAQQFVRVVWNTKPKLIRNDSMAGKDYIVVPMVMLTEGVHAGDQGPYLYTNEEIGKNVVLWNMKPVVVYHPDSPSACTKEFLNSHQIGVIMNAKWDKKNKRLTAEAWLEEALVKKVDPRVWDAIQNGETLELSTGLFAESDEEKGEWNGEEYRGILHNYGPDHLAVLPDQVGACSIEDGAGFYRNAEGKKVILSKYQMGLLNEMVASTLREQLQKAAQAAQPAGEYRYVEDWSEDKGYLIYSTEKGGLYKQSFTLKGNEVTLKGEPTLVIRKVSYEPIKNETKTVNNAKGSTDMDKKKLVDLLISNKAYEEKDRDMLMALDERILERLEKSLHNVTPPAPVAPITPVAPQNAQPKQMTDEEYLASMPPAFRNRWTELQRQEDEQKDACIATITKNPKNAFDPKWLKTQDVPFLKNLANMAVVEKAPEQGDPRFLSRNYGGQGDPVQNAGSEDLSKLPTLVPPSYQNTKDKKEDKKA